MSRVEGADISIQDFLQDNDDTSDKKLQDVFRGATVLVTGCRGFLGSVVFEKLLRSCPEITKLILLIRKANDEHAIHQYAALCRTRLFDRIKMENPQLFDKVQVMGCDPSRPNLGLNQQNLKMITSFVNIVIHADTLQNVNAGLKECVTVNLLMTRHLLQLAAKSRNIEAFVHVSSTLCHFEERMVEERFYTPPLSPQGLLAVVNHLPDYILEDITTGLLGEFPAPCILAENVTEEIIRVEGKNLPVAVIRVPLLLATCKEPLAGWSWNCDVATVVMYVLLGYIRSLHCQKNLLTELVPVDMAANLVIAVAGNLAKTRQEWVNKESEVTQQKVIDNDSTTIYNLVSSNHKPITWKEFYNESLRHGRKVPFIDMVWCVCLSLVASRRLYMLHAFVLHIIPAVILDKIALFSGRQPRWLKLYEDIQSTCDLMSFYGTRQQRYRDNNVRDLWTAMSVSDQQIFDFNMTALDWDEYFYTQCRGIRVYTLKDNLDTVGAAKLKRQRLKFLHMLTLGTVNLVVVIMFSLIYFILMVKRM